MASALQTAVLAVALGSLVACASESEPTNAARTTQTAEPLAPSPVRSTPYADPTSRLGFDVPAVPVRVSATHFDAFTPVNKVKHRFEVKSEKGLLVRVDVWTNPEGWEVGRWMDTHLSYLQKGQGTFTERRMGVAQVPGVLVDTPRSCQAANVLTAVFRVGEHIVAVTCADGEDTAARQVFELVLGSIRREAVR